MLRWFTAPWRGEIALWKVTVLYVPISGVVILSLPWVLSLVGAPVDVFLLIGAWLVLLLAYIVWAVVSLWRSTRRLRPLIRYPMHILTVLLVIFIVMWVLTPSMQDYTVRAKVQEAVNYSNPARTALGIACSEGQLNVGMTHAELSLEPAAFYRGNYQDSIAASVVDTTTVTVTIVMKDIEDPSSTWLRKKPGVKQGEVLIYEGTCSESGMTWMIGGSLDQQYQPKI